MSKKQLLFTLGLLAACACASAVAFGQSATTALFAAQDDGSRAYSSVVGGNYLGVYTEPVTRENMSRYNLSGEPRGVVVTRVVADSPAAKAGLQSGDVILRFDGEEVSSTQKLSRLVSESSPEHTARLTVSRGGGERGISVALAHGAHVGALAGGGALALPGANAEAWRSENGELFRWDGRQWQKESGEEARKRAEEFRQRAEEWRKQSQDWQKNSQEWRKQSEELRRQFEGLRGQQGGFAFALGGGRRIGVTTTPLTDQLADYFGVSRGGGVLVTSVSENSPAAKAGLKAGDIVTEVDGEGVRGAADLSRLVSRKDEGEVTLTVTRDHNRRSVKVTPERSPAPQAWSFPEGLEGFFAAPVVTTPAVPQLFALPPALALPATPTRLAAPTVVTPRLRVLPRLAPIPPVVVRPVSDPRAVVQFLEL
ncbi:MAG: PDZ domain-containing protein [Acidobacteria bacterium]|nr:PDZ domain-containing protein [Acidobacteriota bacterium]